MVHVDFSRIWWCELITGAMPVYSMNMTVFLFTNSKTRLQSSLTLFFCSRLIFILPSPDQINASFQLNHLPVNRRRAHLPVNNREIKFVWKPPKMKKLHLSFFVFFIRISTSCLKSKIAQVWLLEHMTYTAATSWKNTDSISPRRDKEASGIRIYFHAYSMDKEATTIVIVLLHLSAVMVIDSNIYHHQPNKQIILTCLDKTFSLTSKLSSTALLVYVSFIGV
jgi:hypothetical protein